MSLGCNVEKIQSRKGWNMCLRTDLLNAHRRKAVEDEGESYKRLCRR